MLKVSPNLRKLITDELRFVAKNMQEEKVPSKKLFLFSAAYSVLDRAFNIEFNPELVFAHLILTVTHSQMTARLETIGRQAIEFPDGIFDKLAQDVEELANRWDKGQPIDPVLQHVALLAYSVSGNGYYQYLKGKFTL